MLILCIQFPCFGGWQPIESFVTDQNGGSISIASDANGNAIALFTDFGQPAPLLASYFTGGVWGIFQPLDPTNTEPNGGDVSMDPTGTALAIWKQSDTNNIVSAFFNGSNWLPAQTLDTGTGYGAFFTPTQVVAMNGPGQGVAAWINYTAYSSPQTVANFFNGGVWQIAQPIGAGTIDPSISYSTDGSVIVAWLNLNTNTNNYEVWVNNYINGWQTAQMLGTTNSLFPASVGTGIDANGHGVVAWVDANGNTNVSNFDGTNWQAPILLSTDFPNSSYVSVAMAPNGQAIVVWEGSSDSGLSSSFDGTTWAPSISFSNDLQGPASFLLPGATVAIDSRDNAFVVWGDQNENVNSAQLPAGATAWSSPLLIGPTPDFLGLTDNALSENGTGFVIWADAVGEGGENIFGSDAPGLFPPPNPDPAQGIKGKFCANKFVNGIDRVKTITWSPSTSPHVVAYYLSRNGDLIAVIPASGPFKYQDHFRCKHSDVYSLTSVDASGLESAPTTVTIK